MDRIRILIAPRNEDLAECVVADLLRGKADHVACRRPSQVAAWQEFLKIMVNSQEYFRGGRIISEYL